MRILNVGCGKDTYGTDFIDLYPSRKEVMKCDVDEEKLPYPDNTFDEVYSRCLLEHLKNSIHFLKEAYRVLKKNGQLVLITDNAGFWGLFGDVHHGGYERYSKEKDMHYALFTPNHIKNLLKNVGFRKIEVSYWIEEKNILKKHKFLVKVLSFIDKRFSPHIKAVAKK